MQKMANYIFVNPAERLDYKYYILRRLLFEKKQRIGDCSITGMCIDQAAWNIMCLINSFLGKRVRCSVFMGDTNRITHVTLRFFMCLMSFVTFI